MDALDHALNFDSGVVGLSPGREGLRDIEAAAAHGDPSAALALNVFPHRLAGAVAAMATAAGGLDAPRVHRGDRRRPPPCASAPASASLFSESPSIRRRTRSQSPIAMAADDSSARVLVIRAREDLVVLSCPQAHRIGIRELPDGRSERPRMTGRRSTVRLSRKQRRRS